MFLLVLSITVVARVQAAVDEILIQTSEDIDLLASLYNATVVDRVPAIGLYRVSAETSQLAALQNDVRVTASYADSMLDARPSYFVGSSDILAAMPTDTIVTEQYTNQAAVETLRIPEAQTISTGEGIIVAVIDTGAESDHPLLEGRLDNGYDFVDDDNTPDDLALDIDTDNDGSKDDAAGHGSHVAGIIALVAPDATIMPIRALDTNGRGLNFTLAQAIVYAVDQGAHVINLSGNSGSDEAYVQDAVDYAWNNGVVFVASAGINTVGYPANYSNAISVASTNSDGYRTPTSNFGADEVIVYTPGELIMSAYYDGRYARWTGHSMATPFISGLAALMLATGTCEHDCVRDKLLSYARWVDRYNGPDEFLMADFYDAVGAAANQQILDVTVQSRTPGNDDPLNNTRKVEIKLNSVAHSVPLDELKVRYWYSNENSAEEVFHCDWAAVGCSNIDATFGVDERSVENLQYLELSFSAEAGTLFGSDSSGEIHIRTNHTDWSNYDETNDYSFNSSDTFTDTMTIGLYHNNTLIAGRSPNQVVESAVTLSSTSIGQSHSNRSLSITFALLFLLTFPILYSQAKHLNDDVSATIKNI